MPGETFKRTPQPPAPVQERSRKSTQRLLLAAAALIGEVGYERTTLVDIGARAGYSRALVTQRFGSKDGLLRVVLDELVSVWRTAEVAALFANDFKPGSLVQLADMVTERAIADPVAFRSVYGILFEGRRPEPTMLHDYVVAIHAEDRRQIAASLRRGIDAGHIDPTIDPETFANIVISAYRGATYQWLLDPTFDLRGAVVAHAKLLERALAPEQPTRSRKQPAKAAPAAPTRSRRKPTETASDKPSRSRPKPR